MTLWLPAVTPTFLPSLDEREDHPGAGVRLARAGRPLDGEVRAIKLLDQTYRAVDGGFTGTDKRGGSLIRRRCRRVGSGSHSRHAAVQQLQPARRRVRFLGEPHDGGLQHVGANDLGGVQRVRARQFRGRLPHLQVERPSDAIVLDDLSVPATVQHGELVPHADLDVLRRVGVLLDRRTMWACPSSG